MSQLELFEGIRSPVWPSRAEEFDLEAEELARECPDVWEMFARFALELVEAGRPHGGAKAVWERMRWECATSAHRVDRSYRLNNNYTASFARAFERAYPEHAGFFRMRQRPAESARARSRAVAA